MKILEVLFSFRGRISRSEYWLKGIIPLFVGLFVIELLLFAMMTYSGSEPMVVSGAIIILVYLGSLWPIFAILVKRWHDRDRSASWLLLYLIPVVNFFFAIWVLIEIWFLPGTPGDNRFGTDPLADEAQEHNPYNFQTNFKGSRN